MLYVKKESLVLLLAHGQPCYHMIMQSMSKLKSMFNFGVALNIFPIDYLKSWYVKVKSIEIQINRKKKKKKSLS